MYSLLLCCCTVHFYTLEKPKGQARMDTPEDISNIDNTRHRTKTTHTHTRTRTRTGTRTHARTHARTHPPTHICEWNGIWDDLVVSLYLLYSVVKGTSFAGLSPHHFHVPVPSHDLDYYTVLCRRWGEMWLFILLILVESQFKLSFK